MSVTVYTKQGQQIRLTKSLGEGTQGTVYDLPANEPRCVKVYSGPLRRDDYRKLEIMTQNPPVDPAYESRRHRSIAWPLELVYADSRGSVCVGFVMPKADPKKFRQALTYLSPSERRREWGGRFTWRSLYITAMNLASAVGAIHDKGYWIGDLSDANVLIALNTLVTIIDCDSFQVRDPDSQVILSCPVGTPGYTAPEFIGTTFRDVPRTTHADNFALAVVIFKLLMQDTHPYAARGSLVDDLPGTDEKVRNGLFPYTAGTGDISPPVAAPPFKVLHHEIQEMFHRCFVEGHANPTRRPTAAQWHGALEKLTGAFRVCDSNENHVFTRHLGSCPWCEIADQTGDDAFPSSIGFQVALDAEAVASESLEQRVDYYRSELVSMALADGVLTADEEQYLAEKATQLEIPAKQAKKILQDALTSAGIRQGVPPQLEIDKSHFNFEDVRLGSSASGVFTIVNSGGGTLNGPLAVVPSSAKWLSLSQEAIDTSRHRQVVTFEVNTIALHLGFSDTAGIRVESNGGTEDVTVRVGVEIPSEALERLRKWFVPSSAAILASIGGIARLYGWVDGLLVGGLVGYLLAHALSKPTLTFQSARGVRLSGYFVTSALAAVITFIAVTGYRYDPSRVLALEPGLIRAVEESLVAVGYNVGPVDEIWTDQTAAAWSAFVDDFGVAVDDDLTLGAFRRLETERRKRPLEGNRLSPGDVRWVQAALAATGNDPGPVDGAWGARTATALTTFQRQAGLLASGRPTWATVERLRRLTAMPATRAAVGSESAAAGAIDPQPPGNHEARTGTQSPISPETSRPNETSNSSTQQLPSRTDRAGVTERDPGEVSGNERGPAPPSTSRSGFGALPTTIQLSVGTFFDRDRGLMGTSFGLNHEPPAAPAQMVVIRGPNGWNYGSEHACPSYRPAGMADNKTMCWHVDATPVVGVYEIARGGRAPVAGSSRIDTQSILSPPEITALSVRSDNLTVDWNAPVEASSFLVRLNEIPYDGTVTSETLVDGSQREATLGDLALAERSNYQVTVFAFDHDVTRPGSSDGPFNVSSHSRSFATPRLREYTVSHHHLLGPDAGQFLVTATGFQFVSDSKPDHNISVDFDQIARVAQGRDTQFVLGNQERVPTLVIDFYVAGEQGGRDEETYRFLFPNPRGRMEIREAVEVLNAGVELASRR